MADVGQHAMDEIYISWEDSVLAAHERYQELIEEMNSGRLEKYKKDTADYILDGTAHLVDYTGRLFRLPHDMYDGMIENVMSASDRLYELSLKVGIPADVFSEEWKKASEEIRDELKMIKNETREIGRHTREGVKAASKTAIEHVKEGIAISDIFGQD